MEYVQKYRDVGLGSEYWWESLRPENFLTKEEAEKEDI